METENQVLDNSTIIVDERTVRCLRSISQENYILDYHIEKILQKGGQANVYFAVKDNQKYAIKLYHSGQRHLHAYHKQKLILRKINKWKGIVPVIEFLDIIPVKEDKDEKTYIEEKNAIVTLYAQHGDLFQWAYKYGYFQQNLCRFLFKKIIQVFQYLEEEKILHGDIKPENIVLNHNFQPQIIDFGQSKFSHEKVHNFPGSHYYAAPQVLRRSFFNQKSQIYSLGILAFYLLTGQIPFHQAKITDPFYRLIIERKYDRFWKEKRKKVNSSLSKQFQQIFVKMTHNLAEKRPTLEQLFECQWLKPQTMSQTQFQQIMKQKMTTRKQ